MGEHDADHVSVDVAGAPLELRYTPVTAKERKRAAAENEEIKWADLRAQRNLLLAACDWTQLLDLPGSVGERWAGYRQKLRDLPATTNDPANPDWPEPPATPATTQGRRDEMVDEPTPTPEPTEPMPEPGEPSPDEPEE